MTNEQLANMLSDEDVIPGPEGETLVRADDEEPWEGPVGLLVRLATSDDPDAVDDDYGPWEGTVVEYEGASATYDQLNGEWAPGAWA